MYHWMFFYKLKNNIDKKMKIIIDENNSDNVIERRIEQTQQNDVPLDIVYTLKNDSDKKLKNRIVALYVQRTQKWNPK